MTSFTGGEDKPTENFIKSVLSKGVGRENATNIYNKQYTEYDGLLENVGYTGPRVAADKVKELMGDRTDVTILDIGAGTGLQGELLRSLGFVTIDAVDGSEGMLEEAKKKNIYRKTVCHFVGDDPMPFPDHSYDLVVLVGSMGENHLPVNGFKDMIRVLKPGGYIVNVFREGAMRYDCYDGDLNKYLVKLEEEGLWTLQSQNIFPNYTGNADGMCIVHRVK